MTTSLTIQQQQQQKIIKIFQEQIANKNHCLFSTVNQRLLKQQQQFTNTSINNQQTLQQQIAKCAIKLKCQHKQLQLLCFVTYRQNNQFHTYYDISHSVEQLLRRRKINDDCGKITQLYVQFMCVYVKSLYQFDQIIQTVLGYTRQLYEKGVESHAGRNLTLIPPNAIMKDGRMYCQHEPQQFEGMDMDDNLMEKVRQALKAKGKVTLLGNKNVNTVKDSKQQQSKPTKQSKQNITQLQRITDTKKPSKNEQNKRPQHQQQSQNHHYTHKLQKKSLPNKKLLIQSQSEQYYKQGNQLPMFDLKQRQTMIPSQQQHHQHNLQSQKMQLQNQGNYLQNQHNKNGNNNIGINNKAQKMEIQQHNNNKDGSEDEQDSMLMFMNEMKKTDEVNGKKSVNTNNNNNTIKNNNNHISNKPSLGAKSMPAATGKQSASSISATSNNNSKLNDFCSKFTQPPSKTNQSVKQASLFTFLGKKK